MREFAVFAHIEQTNFGEDAQMVRHQALVKFHVCTQFGHRALGMLVQQLQNQHPIGLLQVVEYLIGGFHLFVCEERFHGVPKIANIM